jgi:hypothetical protein
MLLSLFSLLILYTMLEEFKIEKVKANALDVTSAHQEFNAQDTRTLLCYVIQQLQKDMPHNFVETLLERPMTGGTEQTESLFEEDDNMVYELERELTSLKQQVSDMKASMAEAEKDRLLLSSLKDYYSVSMRQLEDNVEQKIATLQKIDEKFNSAKKYDAMATQYSELDARLSKIEELIKKKNEVKKSVTIASPPSRTAPASLARSRSSTITGASTLRK